MMSTHHYHYDQQLYQTAPQWKNPININGNNNIHHTELRPESLIHQQRPTTTPTKHPQTFSFLPTIPPKEISPLPLTNFQGNAFDTFMKSFSNDYFI